MSTQQLVNAQAAHPAETARNVGYFIAEPEILRDANGSLQTIYDQRSSDEAAFAWQEAAAFQEETNMFSATRENAMISINESSAWMQNL